MNNGYVNSKPLNYKECNKLVLPIPVTLYNLNSEKYYKRIDKLTIEERESEFLARNKTTFDVNIKIIDIEPFSTLINILKENINLLPTELKDKLLEILDK